MTLTLLRRPVVVAALRSRRTTVALVSNSVPWHARETLGDG
jgi:hypothetical protein